MDPSEVSKAVQLLTLGLFFLIQFSEIIYQFIYTSVKSLTDYGVTLKNARRLPCFSWKCDIIHTSYHEDDECLNSAVAAQWTGGARAPPIQSE